MYTIEEIYNNLSDELKELYTFEEFKSKVQEQPYRKMLNNYYDSRDQLLKRVIPPDTSSGIMFLRSVYNELVNDSTSNNYK